MKRWLGALAAMAALCGQASAQDWPNRPIHVIVPYTPGSASDIMPRTIFAKVQEQLGQPIVIENRAGAASTLGTGAVAKADPDGYTFLSTSSAFTTVPLTFANLPYEPLRDFAAVIPLVNMANVLVVSPEKSKTLPEFIRAVRARKDVNYVTIGPGSAAHLNSERFRLAAGFEAQPVAYKGAPEGLTDVMTGRVDFYFSPLLPALPLIRAGKLAALAVSSTARTPELPDVPTTNEAGFPNSEYNFWFGVFAPAKTPPAIVERMNKEIAKALQDPEIKSKVEKLGAQPMPMTPAQFDNYVREELGANAELVKAAGIKAQ